MYCKVMTVALLLLVLFVVVNIVEAYDFAIHTDAHPWPKADAEKEIEKLVNAIKNKVNLEVFEPNQRDDLANWVKAHTKDGQSTLILTGITPSTIYPKGNAKPEGSVLEEFLDAGNTIFNTGEYTFYTSEGPAETNETQGLQNIIDVPEAFVWHERGADAWKEDPVVVTPTKEGKKYAPSIKEYGTSYPFHVKDYEGTPWKLEIALAENTKQDLRVEPAVIFNQETGGRLGIFVQAYVGDIPHPGVSFADIISQFILNYHVPRVLTVEAANKLALTWGEIKSSR
ncbi:TPA: hypothetical protein EYN98_24680 [Candidatus Poribacteria bacterium]|nr:hypothetical protein [Candidatus Poribacteria bacterium]HIC01444.1 hypothetical protein [Candidatus Poribacteria bacterium]HIN75806.1 hypothetical protein [Rhodospirillales bacterium]HIO80648.1 hypothetical protein [Candidatus Poribacteria bacterium]